MLKCSTSLWSADLTNLETEIKRAEPFSERFHLDVADGHYVPTMLFFPDLVQAMRPHTDVPFEVHLMCTDPLSWVDPFVEAGVDGFIFCYDSLRDINESIDAVKRHKKMVGISLTLKEGVELLDAYWSSLDLVTIIGTPVGTKGTSMAPSIPDKLRQSRRHIEIAKAKTEVQSDGGIRRNTVPLIHEAGADWIVPGSLMFKEDPQEMRKWLGSL